MITVYQLSRKHDNADHDVDDSSRIAAGDYEKISDVDIIAKAQALVDNFSNSRIDDTGEKRDARYWRALEAPQMNSWLKLTTINSERLWTLRQPAPRITPPGSTRAKRKILEWDFSSVNVQEDEIFCTKDLEPFVFTSEKGLEFDGGRRAKRRKINGRTTSKLRFLHSFTPSLFNLLPQPHLHPYPSLPPQPPTADRDPRNKLEPWPFPKQPGTYAAPSAQTKLKSRWKRCSWVVPIRGELISDNGISLPCQPSQAVFRGDLGEPETNTALGAIIWTTHSMNLFWSFLLQVRSAGLLGAISLSFHARSVYEERDVSTLKPLNHENREHRLRLKDCDHIRIFHDARYAMFLRRTLDAWKFAASEPTQENGQRRKIRPLLSFKLACLDEQGSLMMIC